MITITPSAANKIKELQSTEENTGKNLRVFVQKGGCSGFEYGMQFDAQNEEDTLIQQEGAVIVIDPKSLEQLKGSTIHFDDGLHGKGFELQNPNATNTCGCGRSFN